MIVSWIALAGAIITEVAATLSLKVAATGNRAWYAVVIVGYLAAFVLLSVTLATGFPLGVAYGVWAAAGVALTAVLSRYFFAEPLTPLMGVGIGLIIGGVLLVELGTGN